MHRVISGTELTAFTPGKIRFPCAKIDIPGSGFFGIIRASKARAG